MSGAKVELVAALSAAGKEELAALDARIGELRRELETLEAARKVIDVRVNGKKKRRSARAKPAGQNGEAAAAEEQEGDGADVPGGVAGLVHDCIREYGPLYVRQIANKLDRPEQSVRMAIARQREWFDEFDSGKIGLA